MPSTWILQRFRSALFHENLVLIVLRLLEDSEPTEWEVLNSMYARYRLAPNAKEFRKMLETLVSGAYVGYETVEGSRRLRMTKAGARLLRRLEEEYRAIVSSADVSPAPSQVAR